MKTLKQNSTHKAILQPNSKNIDIWRKGFIAGDYICKSEYLYSIPLEDKDDLFAIFERYDENNRINFAEANEEFSK